MSAVDFASLVLVAGAACMLIAAARMLGRAVAGYRVARAEARRQREAAARAEAARRAFGPCVAPYVSGDWLRSLKNTYGDIARRQP